MTKRMILDRDTEYQCVMRPPPETTLKSYFWTVEMRVVWIMSFGLPRSWPSKSRKRRRHWFRQLDRRIDHQIPVLQQLYRTDDPDDMFGDGVERSYCNRCSNTGTLNCYCGGDLCVCDNNGEYPCPECGWD